MKRASLSILLVCAFTVGSSAAVVDDAPLSTLAVQASAAEAIDISLVSPPVGDPANGETTCHYVAKRSKRAKSCRSCPKRGDVFDSGIPCGDPAPACRRRIKNARIPCPDKKQRGFCYKVKGKKPQCRPSE